MKVKICGITHPEDALHAACCGADYIGIIFAKGSRRKVSVEQAKRIAKATRRGRAEPVAVFVDETLEEILSACDGSGIHHIQLHGKKSQESLPQLLLRYSVIYAMHGNANSYPNDVILLVDSPNPGSGTCFNWKAFSPPKDIPWMLAGGLNPDNVTEAIRILQPQGVCVSSGVEIRGTTKKDPFLVETFVQQALEVKVKI